MKINWGHRLVFFMVLFMTFIVSLVIWMTRESVPLVETDYYEKGINYEAELRKHTKTKGLDHKIKFDSTHQQLIFSSALGGRVQGTASFYRPSDNTLDYEQTFTLNEYGACTLSTAAMKKGLWYVTFEWIVHNDTMASGTEIFIP